MHHGGRRGSHGPSDQNAHTPWPIDRCGLGYFCVQQGCWCGFCAGDEHLKAHTRQPSGYVSIMNSTTHPASSGIITSIVVYCVYPGTQNGISKLYNNSQLFTSSYSKTGYIPNIYLSLHINIITSQNHVFSARSVFPDDQ